MLILLLVIGIGLFIWGSCVNDDNWELDFRQGWGIAFIVISIIGAIILIPIAISSGPIADKKIEMYEEENKRIESRISETVEKYMNYEKDIVYKVSEDEDAFSLISLYPDLKSDQLVQTEIDTYISNNNKIKEIKCNKLYNPVYKFLLYFGH